MPRPRAHSWLVAGFLLVALGPHPVWATEGADEIVQLAKLVAFLRARVRTENPELLARPGDQVNEFREELAKLDLDPPAGVPLDPFLDDLRMAGLLYEEQLRRRRNARRNALIAETDQALADVFEGALAVANSPEGESIVPEVARIFQVIHADRRGQTPTPTPAQAPTTPAMAAAPKKSAPRELSTRDLAEPAEKALAAAEVELRAALAADPAGSQAEGAEGFGDMSKKVASAGAPRVLIRQLAPLYLSKSAEEALPAEDRLAKLPPPRPRPEPRKIVPAPKAKVLAAKPPPAAARAPVRAAAPVLKAPTKPEQLAQVLAKVKSLVVPQVRTPGEYPAVLRGTLSTFGIDSPAGFRPQVGDTPQELADALLAAKPGSLDLTLARAALAL